jgi:hypothetical protein
MPVRVGTVVEKVDSFPLLRLFPAIYRSRNVPHSFIYHPVDRQWAVRGYISARTYCHGRKTINKIGKICRA